MVNATQTFWSTAFAIVVSTVLGYIFGGMGKVSKKECEANHKMENMVVEEIKGFLNRIEESVKSLRQEVSDFQREAREEDRALHNRVTDMLKKEGSRE